MNRHPVTVGTADVDWHGAFIRYVPRVFPAISFQLWYELGGWPEDYRAFAIAHDDEIVASASLQRMTVIMNGRELTGWQLGAVGVVPEWRGKGLQREIMARLLAAPAEEEFVFLFANDSVLGFYPLFGFERAVETLFGAEHVVAPRADALRTLSLGRAEDRALLARLAAQAAPVTRRFGARNYGGILLWYWTNFYEGRIHYCADDDAIVIAEQAGDRLRICDVLAHAPIDLRWYLPRIAASPVRRVEFGFTPEAWWPEAQPIAEYRASSLFVRGRRALPRDAFKFPMLAQT